MEVGVLGGPSFSSLISALGFRVSREAFCSHPYQFRLVKACWVGASSRGV